MGGRTSVAALLAHPRTPRRAASAAVSLVLIATGALLPSVASADTVFGPQGTGAGQLRDPTSLAVDYASGDVYVAEGGNASTPGNSRISVFDSDGNFLRAFGWGVDTGANALETCTAASTCQAGIAGSGGGQLSGSDSRLAVDNDPSSPSYHDVYVYDSNNNRVQRFTPAGAFVLAFGDNVNQTTSGDVCTAASGNACKAAVQGFGAGQLNDNVQIALGAGTIYLADCTACGGVGNPTHRVQTFDPTAGALTGQPLTVSGAAAGRPAGLAADSSGDFYLSTSGELGIHKYDPSGNQLALIGSQNQSHLALDSSDDLYSLDQPSHLSPLSLYDPAGNLLSVGYGNQLHALWNTEALAAGHSATGDYYGIESSATNKVVHVALEPPGPLVLPGVQADPSQALDNAAYPLGNTSATLNARINPEGKSTTYHFDYISDADYAANGGGFSGAHPATSTPAEAVTNEIQELSVSATAGQYRLSFGAETTADLPFDATAAQIQAALEALPSIGAGNVSVVKPFGRYDITFTGALADTNVAQLIAADGTAPLSGGSATVTTLTQGGPNFYLYQLASRLTNLTPETTYHFRVVATNADGTDTGPESTFTTRAPFEFDSTFSTDVGVDSATLHAELNPLGIAATGHFEYVDEATYQADKSSGDGFQHAHKAPDVDNAESPLDFGDAADQPTERSVQLSGLQPGTSYRYRLLASDSFTAKPGPVGAFHTFAPSDAPDTACPNQGFRTETPSASLPDCRAYEMVSPLAKGGDDIAEPATLTCSGCRARIDQATPAGDALTYTASQSFADPASSAAFTSQYLADRDPGAGWGTRNISPPGGAVILYYNLEDLDTQFQAFSEDLCTAYYRQISDRPLAPGDQPGYVDLYRTHNCTDPLGYDLLTTAAPLNLPANGTDPDYYPRVQGVSADGARVVFRANAKLPTSGTAASDATGSTVQGGKGGPVFQLYLQGAGSALRAVSVMPSPGGATPGAAASLDSSVGTGGSGQLDYRGEALAGAVSADATRVFWSTSVGTTDSQNRLYLRVNADHAQSPVSAGKCTDPARACTYPVSESVDPGAAQFLTANPAGTEALFYFTTGAHAGELYTYDVAKAIAGDPNPATLIAAGLPAVDSPVLGASADLSAIYFLSTQSLAPGAVAGQQNLYLYRQGQGLRFIASGPPGSLVGSVFLSGLGQGSFPNGSPFRVSADGERAVFVSNTPLTGYDNADVSSGQPADEVFLYDATADAGAGQLLCVSCNPTGARPRAAALPNGSAGFDHLAARIPGAEYSLHSSRILSADGTRLFFESYEALSPADTNGRWDVYQWQAPDSGGPHGCHATDADYFASNGGCISLISSGKSDRDSEFLDASADGSDVFFKTDSQLYAGDTDPLVDIYDARIDGGFPPPTPAPPPCDLNTGACEGQGTDPGSGAGPGTPNFTGPGNPTPNRACPKGKVRQGNRCLARHHHKRKRHHKRHRRAHHNRRAPR